MKIIILIIISVFFFLVGVFIIKNKKIKSLLFKIIRLTKLQKVIQVVTPPESDFNNDFDWSKYSYGESYNHFEKYLYDQVHTISKKYNNKKTSKNDFLLKLKGPEIDFSNNKPKILKKETLVKNDRFSIEKVKLSTNSDTRISFDVITGIPTKNVKNKTVIMLHGFSSSPEKIMGLAEKDYTNNIGKVFLENGYNVFAPFLFNHGERLSNIAGMLSLLGTTLEWFEVNKVITTINYLKEKGIFNSTKIGIYGISGGGTIAMYAAAIDNRIDCVASSGIVQNRLKSLSDYASRKGFYERKNFNMRYHYFAPSVPFYYIYSFPEIAKLIAPKPMIIEAGREDRILFNYDFIEECDKIKKQYENLGKNNNFSCHIHDGVHESDPENTLNWFDEKL